MQHLTLEEHKKIAEFLRVFHDLGHEVFELIKKRFPNSKNPLNDFSVGVNKIVAVKHYCIEASESDRRTTSIDVMSKEWDEWRSCYENITGWCVLDDREEED